jgi:uncharacterized membrane protein YfcA
LFAGLGPEQIALALVAALAAAFVRGLAGFGMAIMLVPVLGLAIPPAEAVVVANWLGLLIGLVGLRKIIADSEHTARTIAVLAVVATPLGVWLLAMTDPALARFLIAVVAFVAFLLVLLPNRPGHRPGQVETGVTGVASGILTGFAGMPGPPVVPYYLRRMLPAAIARASMMLIFLATSFAGVASAYFLDVSTTREPVFALALYPAVLLGNWLGTLAFGKVSDAAWRMFTGGVLGAAALAALVKLLQT